MKNDTYRDSVDQGPNDLGDSSQISGEEPATQSAGAERALRAQLELSQLREIKARKEIERVRADNARVRDSIQGLQNDAEIRLSMSLLMHSAEQEHLQRIIKDLEATSHKAKVTFEQQQAEYSSLNTRLLLKVAELEETERKLEVDVLRLRNEVATYSRTMVKKETFGRDKARRLDTALEILAQERSKISNLQKSSSMRIGRLITSSLKNPSSAFALLWRLPRMVFLETKKNTGKTEK